MLLLLDLIRASIILIVPVYGVIFRFLLFVVPIDLTFLLFLPTNLSRADFVDFFLLLKCTLCTTFPPLPRSPLTDNKPTPSILTDTWVSVTTHKTLLARPHTQPITTFSTPFLAKVSTSSSLPFSCFLADRFFAGRGGYRRLDPLSDDAPWVSTQNTTLAFGGLPDGTHALTVRARETEAEGGSSDKVRQYNSIVLSATVLVCVDVSVLCLLCLLASAWGWVGVVFLPGNGGLFSRVVAVCGFPFVFLLMFNPPMQISLTGQLQHTHV